MKADPQLVERLLYFMKLQRELEERIEKKLYRQGKIVGGVYVGRGQEAIPVGVGLLAEPEDALFPTHRDLALFLIRGVHPRQIFAQYMGRVGGLTRHHRSSARAKRLRGRFVELHFRPEHDDRRPVDQ